MQRLLFPGRAYAGALALSTIFWLLAWYWDTARTMVEIWERSDTFAHGYLIVPISAWLVWRRRAALAALDMRPNFLVLPLLVLAGTGWLLGEVAGARIVQQYALVLMIPLLVWCILGNEVAKLLAFPLFFLLLAVPFGEFLLPPLMEHTADFTVFALRLSGIPLYREGLFFTVPSGSWSVVEACSGLRYLIASVTLGLLYAYLTYRSLARRAAFVALSVIVPIVANWLRAYMIVMIGHLSGMKYAVGVDHLIYGWVFFGIVMLILFWIGSFWREDLASPEFPRNAAAAGPPAQRGQTSLGSIITGTIAVAVLVAVWPVAAARLDAKGPAPVLAAPQPAGGWQVLDGRLTTWAPRYRNPRVQIHQSFAKADARTGLFVGYYRNQHEGAELITSVNTLVDGAEREWVVSGETRRELVSGEWRVAAVETRLRSRSTQLLVWRWYWVDGEYTVNQHWAKLLQAKSTLFGRGDDGAVVMVYAPYADDPQAAARKLQDFVSIMLPAITRSLEHARRAQPGA